jgi:hypothetical protein
MIKIKITISSLTYEKDIPTSWDEVTYRQFLEMYDCGEDYAKLISLFTGIEVEKLRKAKIFNFDKVLEILQFLSTKPADAVPPKILKYTIPKNLEFETIGQFEDLKKEIENSKSLSPFEQMQRYPLYCATYACSQEFGEYDWRHAERIAPYFLNAPALEVLAVGNFTLVKLIGLKFSIKTDFQRPLTPLQRWTLVFRLWVKRMVSSVHWFIWKRKLDIKGKTS